MVFCMNRKIFGTSIVVLIIDQILKLLVQTYETHYTVISNLFAITYYQNSGAAWSILEGKTFLLIGISVVVLVLVKGKKKK